jgi:hypothetical protein
VSLNYPWFAVIQGRDLEQGDLLHACPLTENTYRRRSLGCLCASDCRRTCPRSVRSNPLKTDRTRVSGRGSIERMGSPTSSGHMLYAVSLPRGKTMPTVIVEN